jgi:predicted outer membrane repeat protein
MVSASDYARGGAIYAFNADLNLEYNTFFGNVATVPNTVKNAQGGALCFIGGEQNLHNCTFTNNSATYLPTGVQVCSGGAIFIQEANSVIKNCEFDGNLSHGEGGAIRISLGTAHELSANRFTANTSVGNGGAISVSSTNLTAYNNIFDGNSSEGFGGSVHCQGSAPSNSFVNNTFYDNSTTNTQGSAGIYMDGGVHHILNNIFYENKMSNGSTTATGADVLFYNATGSTFLNNLYQTGSTNPNDGNIGYDGNNNPLFVDAENGVFFLQAESPCINAGSNMHYLSSYEPTDFLSNERIQGGTVDMGALEFIVNTSGINDHAKTEETLVFYPNPVKTGENMHVQLLNDQSLQLLDLSGKILGTFHCQIGENSIRIDVPAGIYVLQASDGKRTKIIIL